MSQIKFSRHLKIDRYGDFQLTAAIRPSVDLQVIPEEGFRIDIYRDPKASLQVPVLAASVSSEHLFETFLDLLEPLGSVVNVVLETSHESRSGRHKDLFRAHIDLPVLKSHFCEFEDLLVEDGCTGVAIVSTNLPMEVQFDEHKLLVVYAADLEPFERVLIGKDIFRKDGMKLITEGEHLHTTDSRFPEAFEQMCFRLSVGSATERVNW